ncbi:MAG: invasin domain 3-containing protein, partial [bacterium]
MEEEATASGAISCNGTLKYKGSVPQFIGDEFGDNISGLRTFGGSGGVVIENAAGVSFVQNAEIDNTLTLTSGNLYVGNNTLYLLGGPIAGAGADTKLITGSSSSLIFISDQTGLFVPSSVTDLYTLKFSSTLASSPLTLHSSINCSYYLQIYGKIITGSNVLTTANAAGGYATSTYNYVYGYLRHIFPIGGSSFFFPIGDAVNYTPADLAFQAAASGGSLTVNTTPGSFSPATSGLINIVNRYWHITNDGMTGVTYSGEFYFVTGDLPSGAVTNKYVVRKYSGGWQVPSYGAHYALSTKGTAMTFVSDVTSYSDYIIGEGTPDATQSTLTPTSATILGNGLVTQRLTVTAKDVNGNNLGAGGATVLFQKKSGDGNLVGSVKDEGDGTYWINVKWLGVSSGTFTATLNTFEVKSGTATQTEAIVNYIAGPIYYTKSTLTPTSANIIGNGTCTLQLTVTAKDAAGNLITTGGANLFASTTVTFVQASGTGSVVAASTDVGDGTYTTFVTAPVGAGTGGFQAKIGPTNYVRSGTLATTTSTITYQVSNAGPDQSKCNNSTFTLAGNAALTPGVGTWSVVSGTGSVTSINSATSGVTGVTAGSITALRWTIVNGSCTTSDDVSLFNAPAAAAGTDQTQCNNSTFTLAGNAASPGTGTWTIISGPGTITSSNSATSTVTGVTAGGTTTLRWTVVIGSCNTTDDVILTNAPDANAGPDQFQCDGTTDFTLAGNAAAPGVGTWTKISGDGAIVSPNSAVSDVTGVPVGTTTVLRWTIVNGSCSSSDDITLWNAATADAGADQNQCSGSTTFTLAGNSASPGTGTWSVITGSGSVTDIHSATSEITNVPVGGTTTLQWTIANGS